VFLGGFNPAPAFGSLEKSIECRIAVTRHHVRNVQALQLRPQALSLELVLTRAYQIPMSAYAGADAPYYADLDSLLTLVKEEASAYLEAKVNELRENGIEKVSSILLLGSGADEIIELAQGTPDNLIAMCTHGRSGVERWVLGSVTEKVVRHSGDPVLVVRAE
jgi:nucleotide-binding universal stress UspA family protein